MALPVRKGYKGAPANAVLTNSPNTGDTTFTVDTVAGWPTTFPFYVVVEPGTSKEEKVRVTAISTLTLTVVRGQDDTSAVGHNASAAIYPVFTADEADEANLIASAMTTKGDLIATDGTSVNRLGVGTNTYVLQADSTATNGFKWGQVATAGIADDAVTSAKIADGTIALADLASAVQNLLVPVGTIAAYAGVTAPTGWLLCDGTSTTGYASLTALVGATTPDLRGKFALGDNATLTLLASGGSTTIAEANLPSHTHTFSATTGAMSANATLSHSITDPTHSHTIDTFDPGTGGSTIGSSEPGYGANAGDEANVVNSASTGISIGNHDVSHTHSVSGTTGSTGAGTAYYQPYVVVNYIIKHD